MVLLLVVDIVMSFTPSFDYHWIESIQTIFNMKKKLPRNQKYHCTLYTFKELNDVCKDTINFFYSLSLTRSRNFKNLYLPVSVLCVIKLTKMQHKCFIPDATTHLRKLTTTKTNWLLLYKKILLSFSMGFFICLCVCV